MAKFLELQNVEKLAEENPETFFIPFAEERKSQRAGDAVRLHFLLKDPSAGEPQAERMWVTVTRERSLFQSYKGRLQNSPAFIDDLEQGAEVSFDVCHIAQTIIKKGDPRWLDCAGLKALVSAMCFEPGEFARFIYRQAADREEDSGWRIFTGQETDDYVNNSANIRVVEIGYMLDRDPSLLQPLKEGIGAVFERRTKAEPWRRVRDWNPPD